MANITQRITLEGAQAIISALGTIGKAGETAFAKLQDTANLNANLKQLIPNLDKITSSLKNLGTQAVDTTEKALAFTGAVGSAFGRLTLLSGGLGAAVNKALGFFRAGAEKNEGLEQTAAALGVTTGEAKALQKAFQSQGISSDEADTAINRMSKSVVEADKESKNYRDSLDKLNKSYQSGQIGTQEFQLQLAQLKRNMSPTLQAFRDFGVNLHGTDGELISVTEAFRGVIAGSDRFTNSTKLTAASMALLGRAGGNYTKLLRSDVDAFDGFVAKGRQTSSVLDTQNAENLSKLKQAFNSFDIARGAFSKSILTTFAPQVTSLLSAFTGVLTSNKDAFTQIAQAVSVQVQPAVDALLEALNSPDIGATVKKGVEGIIAAVKDLGIALKTVIIPAFQAIKTGADFAAKSINDMFGTNLTGGVILAGAALAKYSGLLKVVTTGFGLLLSAGKLVFNFLPLLGQAFTVLRTALGLSGGAFGLILIAVTLLIAYVVEHWDEISQAVSASIKVISDAWTSLVQYIKDRAADYHKFIDDTWSSISQGASDLGNSIKTFFGDAWAYVTTRAQNMWTTVSGYFNKLLDLAKSLLGVQSQAAAGASGGDGAQSNAAGGAIRGRGTGTSDSILSWLSNGEFVVKASSARKLGTDFLNRLNQTGAVPAKFSLGGLASSVGNVMPSIPRFATGGAVQTSGGGDMRPFVLQIGDKAFTGLRAPASAVDELTRYATGKNMASAGRRPSWYRG